MRALPTLSWLEPKTRLRLYQLAISLVATVVVLFLFDIPKIIDDVPRVLVSRAMPRPVSGEIVLITTETELDDKRTPAELEAAAINALADYNPALILIEGRFSKNDAGIPALQQAVDHAEARTMVAWPTIAKEALGGSENEIMWRNTGERDLARVADLNVDAEVVDANSRTITGYVFEGKYGYLINGRRYPRLATAISGIDRGEGTYPIDYRYTIQSIPTFSIGEIETGKVPDDALRGKRIVIASSTLNGLQTYLASPTRDFISTLTINIIAAETLMSKSLTPVMWPTVLAIFGLLMALCFCLPTILRRIAYAVLVAASLALPFIAARYDLLMPTGMVYTLFVIFAAVRARSNWRERAAGMDKASGLPNFTALEDDFVKARGRLVVARIDKYEEILASLETRLHRSFILQIAQRLSVGNETQIYTDSTGHFAWFDEMEHARSHISGLLALASAPLRVENRTLDFACSFGIHDTDPEKPRQAISATIVAAELATRKPNRIALVSEQEESDADWQLSLHSSLDHAIAHQHIYLLFQPQCLLENGHVVGAEALVRWSHPQRGEISPTQFIPYIEKAGRLKPLTAHTLRLAARSATAAYNAGARVSVNISATLLAEPDFVALVCDNIAAGGGRPETMTIEITETAKIEDYRAAARNLEILRERGFHISLDDFGTGEANLSLLVELPCDEIKIDRSFVTLATVNDRARIVIRALADTARKSGMRLVAEGIETPEEQAMLVSLGCTIGQGYLYGRPMRITELLEMADFVDRSDSEKLTLY